MSDPLDALMAEVRACAACADHLPLGPRPVLRAAAAARLLIIGQAPGTRVHETGIPWNDPSGDRLRVWLGVDRATFYDEGRIAIVPMGLCYPGRAPRGGDNPPRPECAPLWHERIRARLPAVELTLLVGHFAQVHYLGARRKETMTATVFAAAEYAPAFFPLPHPSWRNTHWLKNHPWFDTETIPALRRRVAPLLR